WQLSFVALTVGRGSMDSRAKVNRTLGLVVLLVGSILPGRAQLSKNEPASVSQIQDEIKQHPDSPKLYVALGLAYWDRNDFSHALEAFQRAVQLGPTSAEAHNWLGVATLERGDLPGAVARSEEHTSELQSPDHHSFPTRRSSDLSQIQDEIKQHPDSPKLYVALGLAYWDRNDFSHALEAFQRAVQLGPTSAEAHNWLGVATLERGDLPGAVA